MFYSVSLGFVLGMKVTKNYLKLKNMLRIVLKLSYIYVCIYIHMYKILGLRKKPCGIDIVRFILIEKVPKFTVRMQNFLKTDSKFTLLTSMSQ